MAGIGILVGASIALSDPGKASDIGRTNLSRQIGPMPLYGSDIPNSIPGPDVETHTRENETKTEIIRNVSRPTYTAYLPLPSRASGVCVVVFPGGGYRELWWEHDGTSIVRALLDRGIAAILVKYRLPSEETMVDKTIGPLQDAQQALLNVRENAKPWGIDPEKVGVMGFSAGGHLAAMAGTHFDKVLVPNPNALSVRPNFMILVYAPDGMWTNSPLLGPNPSVEKLREFSNDLHVSVRTPPTLLLAAENDSIVDVDDSIRFYEALRHNRVPAELVLFPKGQHGFSELSQDQWTAPLWAWLAMNGWLSH